MLWEKILIKLYKIFSNRDDSMHQGTFSNVWRHLWLLQLQREMLWASKWVKARDAAKHPLLHSKALSCPNVNSATVETLSQMNKTVNNSINVFREKKQNII